MNEGWSDYVCRCGRRLARATVSIPPTMLRLPIAVYASVFACPGYYTRLPERGLRTRWFETDDDGSVGAPIHPVSSGAPARQSLTSLVAMPMSPARTRVTRACPPAARRNLLHRGGGQFRNRTRIGS